MRAMALLVVVVAIGCDADMNDELFKAMAPANRSSEELVQGQPSDQPMDVADETTSAASQPPATPQPSARSNPPASDHVPYWEGRKAPEVVPFDSQEWVEAGDTTRNPETGKDRLSSGLFAGLDDALDSASKMEHESSYAEAVEDSRSHTSSTPGAASAPTTAPPPSMPVDPAPGSSPGRPNPFGFPAGYSGQGHSHGHSPAPSPSSPSSPSNSSGIARVPEVRMLRPVAVPQSLPTGTAMGFRVDYQFLTDFYPQAQYGLIIQPPKGNAVGLPVKLQQQGNVSHFVTEWGPMSGVYKLQLVIIVNDQPRPMCRAVDAVYSP